LPLATSLELRQRIETNILTVSGFLHQKELEPVYVVLKEIQESKENPSAKLRRFHNKVLPDLSGIQSRIIHSEAYTELCDVIAIVLRGISLGAWKEHRDMTTAVSANDLALRHVRDKNLRQHLTDDKKVLAQMAAQKRANLVARLGCLVPIGIIAVIAIIGSFTSNQTSSSNTSHTATPLSGNHSQSGTYRIPSYRTAELDRDRQAIEAAKSQSQLLDSQLGNLGAEIERDRLYLDHASQYQVDAFNTKVGSYNSLLQQARAQEQVVNQMVDDYNAKLRRDSQ